nr:protein DETOXIFICATION 27-like [Ipomoea batatas]
MGFVGVAVGAGWQAYVAYINLGCYYLLGVLLDLYWDGLSIKESWFEHLVSRCGLVSQGVWSGMIGGTTIQTLILAVITIRTDWNNEARNANRHVEKWDAVHHVKP